MRILLVEDEESKRQQVTELLRDEFPKSAVVEAKSLNSALRRIAEDVFDLVILDMTMPTFDIASDEEGGRPQAYGGRELLRHMKRRGVGTPVIVLTQFDRFGKEPDQRSIDELDTELARDHQQNYLGSIRYNVAVDTWRNELVVRIARLGQD
jgi:CheY-like chemotaxis protein